MLHLRETLQLAIDVVRLGLLHPPHNADTAPVDGSGGRVPACLAQEVAQAEPQLQGPAGRQAEVTRILLSPSIQKLRFLVPNTPAGVAGSEFAVCGGAELAQQPLHLAVEGLGQLPRHVRLARNRRLIIVS